MTGGDDKSTILDSGRRCAFGAGAAAWLFAASLAIAAATAAAADDQTPPNPSPSPQSSAPDSSLPPQPPPVRRGFLNDIGRWWDEGIADFNAKMKDARGKFEDFKKKSDDAAKDAATVTSGAMKNAADASKDAATAIGRLPIMRMIEARERCPKALNGAPNCDEAAAKVCRTKGFSSGKPLGVSSSENCPPTFLMSGNAPAEGECPVETIVLLAACQ